ncbi:hypothetical protein ACIRU3_46620 [Streptomyces sp. NPDC101151]|uniref:hypothetical protein n=1 Tax=Streptomyces sp. NPDC101151 TaxID=3366115 RepID=UPI00381E17C2
MSVEDKARHILLKLGMWWPEADSGQLRDAAKAWRTFAGAVDDVRSPVHRNASSIIHHNTGESIVRQVLGPLRQGPGRRLAQ